jgi:hypothetical protein
MSGVFRPLEEYTGPPHFYCGRPMFHLLGVGVGCLEFLQNRPFFRSLHWYFRYNLDFRILLFGFKISSWSQILVFLIWSCYASREFHFCSLHFYFLFLCCSPYLWPMCKYRHSFIQFYLSLSSCVVIQFSSYSAEYLIKYWGCPINNVDSKWKILLAKTYKIKVIQYSEYRPSCLMVFTHFSANAWNAW